MEDCPLGSLLVPYSWPKHNVVADAPEVVYVRDLEQNLQLMSEKETGSVDKTVK